MQAALSDHGGLWMGWSGKSSGAREPGKPVFREEGRVTYALTDLRRADIDEYYAGFANSVLWPLCHYRLDLTDYARKDMAGYFRVNRFFAQQLVPLLRAINSPTVITPSPTPRQRRPCAVIRTALFGTFG
jgi:trehalose 6-phosphate synthase